jgi:hypothetical protein
VDNSVWRWRIWSGETEPSLCTGELIFPTSWSGDAISSVPGVSMRFDDVFVLLLQRIEDAAGLMF